MAPMTRAEAVCAATNIIKLCDALNESVDRFPDDYYQRVTTQAQSMRERILENTRFPRVTEKMDAWFRKAWDGLKRWDHQDEHGDELFAGLSGVIQELEAQAESCVEGAGAAGDARGSVPLRPKKGRENTEEMNLAQPRGTPTKAPVAPVAPVTPETPETPKTPETTGAKELSPRNRVYLTEGSMASTQGGEPGLSVRDLVEDVVRLREGRISVVLSQFVAQGVRVIEKSVVHHVDFEAILKKTTSDRTQQLLHAAFLAGKIAGFHDLSGELIALLKGKQG